MLKALLSAVAVVVILLGIGSVKQGLSDAWRSVTHWSYYPVRDMRKSVAIVPNHTVLRGPDSLAVDVRGRERTYGLEGIELATRLAETLRDPFVAEATDDSSLARGSRKFIKTCVPCHGKAMAGDGAVAALFMPPPDLLAQATRERKDGYLFSYIRHGGAVMPAYGAQVTEREAWDLIHYIRHQQKVSPR